MELPQKKKAVKGQEVRCLETSIAFRYPFYRLLIQCCALFQYLYFFFPMSQNTEDVGILKIGCLITYEYINFCNILITDP